MKNFFLLLIFIFLTPFTLGLSFVFLNQLDSSVLVQNQPRLPALSQLYASLPVEIGFVKGAVTGEEARHLVLKEYLEKYHSPLAPYAEFIFAMSEKYELDYRLIVAIAQCESNLCKKSPPESYNCWGFENGATRFLSWEQAIEQVAKTLKEGYYDQGLTTPEEIMPKYAPPSVEIGGPWAQCVNQFLEEIELLPWKD
jgi:hypothetical protein